ncbi:MAG: hypothetical protein AB1646_10730 [Thermodesulfobacteriota bacterium]
MCRLMVLIVISLAVLAPTIATADQADTVVAMLRNRQGSSSYDGRDEVYVGPVKTGCKGDTFHASVTIGDVNAKMEGNGVSVTISYSGKYTRQGWIMPCIQSPPPHGRELRDVRGKFTFKVTQQFLQPPKIQWGHGSEYGEVSDSNHDSNRYAIRAVQDAINGAFR